MSAPAAVAAAGDTRALYDDVAAVYAPIAAAVFVIVAGAIVLLVWRGRRRAAAGGRDERPVAEGIYVGVLAVIVAGLVAVTFAAQGKIEDANAGPGVDVSVVAAKWNWRFSYPRYGISVAGREGVPATLVVPAGREVRFSATALEVLHGFWIPSRRFQRQLVPGRRAHFTLVFPEPGFTSNATCSMYCGLGHGDMRFNVRVLAPADFDAWARAGGREG